MKHVLNFSEFVNETGQKSEFIPEGRITIKLYLQLFVLLVLGQWHFVKEQWERIKDIKRYQYVRIVSKVDKENSLKDYSVQNHMKDKFGLDPLDTTVPKAELKVISEGTMTPRLVFKNKFGEQESIVMSDILHQSPIYNRRTYVDKNDGELKLEDGRIITCLSDFPKYYKEDQDKESRKLIGYSRINKQNVYRYPDGQVRLENGNFVRPFDYELSY